MKHMTIQIKKQTEPDTYGGYITTINRDRDGEIVLPNGIMNAKQFLESNPVVFYDHSWMFGQGDMKLPIGKALTLAIDQTGIKSTFRFSSLADKEGELANKIKALVDDGILNTFSIGYIPKENVYNPEEISKLMKDNGIPIEQLPNLITTKWEILEYSVVGIPSNRESVMTDMAPDKALKIKAFLDYMQSFETQAEASGTQEPVKQPLSVAEKMASVLKR